MDSTISLSLMTLRIFLASKAGLICETKHCICTQGISTYQVYPLKEAFDRHIKGTVSCILTPHQVTLF